MDLLASQERRETVVYQDPRDLVEERVMLVWVDLQVPWVLLVLLVFPAHTDRRVPRDQVEALVRRVTLD